MATTNESNSCIHPLALLFTTNFLRTLDEHQAVSSGAPCDLFTTSDLESLSEERMRR